MIMSSIFRSLLICDFDSHDTYLTKLADATKSDANLMAHAFLPYQAICVELPPAVTIRGVLTACLMYTQRAADSG